MRVAFDSRPVKHPRGLGRYSRCLLSALREAGRGDVIETGHPRRCDVFHSPWIEGAMLHCPVPMVVTVHDLTPVRRAGEFMRSGLRYRLRYLAVQRATRVIVPTQAVADEATRSLGIAADRVAVVAKAPAPTVTRRSDKEVAEVRARLGLPESYLLWVGPLRTPEPRKRIVALARAKRTMPLVLVGASAQWARELDQVTLTGHVSDDELAAIYTGAHALVFPSDDDGFGLAPIEALACGTPVVASDSRAVREVLGSRAQLRDAGDFDGLIAAAEAARRPAPTPPAWTWKDIAEATWKVYQAALVEWPSVPARERGGAYG
jgi:alpha-1,3-rhamnosyl/mannosyltransferase